MKFQIIYGMFLLLIAIYDIADSKQYDWPMKIKEGLTSTFCEYRDGHFHAGVDFKTWDREGIPVYSVDSGSIYKLRASPWGYGKAIYVLHNDSTFAIYAHLSGFAPKLDSTVLRTQKKRNRYTITKVFKRGEIIVKRGELIGFSGSTGIGAPHLHFELRDKNECPVNPLENGILINDSQNPVPKYIMFRPLNFNSKVNCSRSVFISKIIREKNRSRTGTKIREFTIKDRIVIDGQAGLGISVIDLAYGLSNRLCIYKARLFFNDSLVYSSRYSKFCYSNTHQIGLDRDISLIREGKGRFHRLWVSRENRLKFYKPDTAFSGVIYVLNKDSNSVPSLDTHRIRIEVEDFNGNRAVIKFPVFFDSAYTCDKSPDTAVIPDDSCGFILSNLFGRLEMNLTCGSNMKKPPSVTIIYED
ncbi:MAG: M23 family metallopeptidase, partial [bacterium]